MSLQHFNLFPFQSESEDSASDDDMPQWSASKLKAKTARGNRYRTGLHLPAPDREGQEGAEIQGANYEMNCE